MSIINAYESNLVVGEVKEEEGVDSKACLLDI